MNVKKKAPTLSARTREDLVKIVDSYLAKKGMSLWGLSKEATGDNTCLTKLYQNPLYRITLANTDAVLSYIERNPV